ncbi:hypothetical protein [Streptomyces xanthophaeus]
MTAALYGALVKVRYHVVWHLPTAPAAVAVVSQKDSPCCHELTGESGFLGKVALSRVHEPDSVACPSIEAFGAPPQPEYMDVSIWWAYRPRSVAV